MKDEYREQIIKYTALGIPTFPVRGKVAAVKWEVFQTRLPTSEEIDSWTGLNGITGIAGAMGEVSGAMVIDCDIKNPKKICDPEIIKRLREEGHPEVQTGSKGSQFWIKNDSSLGFTSNSDVLTGVDIKAQKGYAVLPPSTAQYGQDELEYAHYNGNIYKWIFEYKGQELKSFPVWILDLINQKGKNPRSNNGSWKDKIINPIEDGSRNCDFTSIIGGILSRTPEKEWQMAWEEVKLLNNGQEIPLSEIELKTIFESIAGKEIKKRQPLIDAQKSLPPEYAELKNKYSGDAGIGILEISKFLIGKYHFKTIAGKIDELYVYYNGIYSSDESGKIIKKESQLILQNKFSPHNVNLITGQVAAQTYFDGKREEFENTSEHLICIENGILNLFTKELLPHNPDLIFLSKIPVTFNPYTDCPLIKEFISSVFNEEDIPVIQEWIGYILYRKYIFKKALILLGERDSGKTTFVEVLKPFVGKRNHCALSLQEICFDSFAIKNLYAKFLNTYDDLDFRGIKDAGKIKMVTGGGTISGDVKFGDRIIFNNYAKLLFATNKIPQNNQNDPAYYSRWIVINCNNRFDDNNPKTDRQLLSKINTESELSGLLNWALEGFARLMKNKKFSYAFSVEEVQIIMEKSGSSLASFIHNKLEEKTDSWISKEKMYERYEKYVIENKLAPKLAKGMVGRELTRYAPYIYDSKQNKVTGWRNVSFIGFPEPEEDLSPEAEGFFKRNDEYLQAKS